VAADGSSTNRWNGGGVSEITAVDSSADLYEQLARIGKAVASAHRAELLDLLCQGEAEHRCARAPVGSTKRKEAAR
jgi:hypothetical protein